jgi:hypothetical protein
MNHQDLLSSLTILRRERRVFLEDCLPHASPIHVKIIPKAIAMTMIRSYLALTLPLVLTLALMTPPASAADKPVKVYILSGQSNMVGIGQVTGGGSRWGSEFIDPVLSVYSGKYDPDADYEKMEPAKTLKLRLNSPSAASGASIQSFRATCGRSRRATFPTDRTTPRIQEPDAVRSMQGSDG